jgi:Ca2+-binding RTX toxin-like protein
MNLQADRIGRRALTVGAAAGSILAATLTFAATEANAAYTAQVKAGTLQIRGDGASDKLVLAPTPTQLIVDVGEDGTADFTFDRTAFTAVSVQAGDGDDEVRVLNAATPIDATIDGGAGDDTLLGGNGNETLLGGAGNDFVDGNIGADTAQLGSGNDTFQWDPGDGSDSVDGQSGTDSLAFNGSNIGEEIHVAGNTLTRNVAAVTTTFAGLENLNLRTFGGVDAVDFDGPVDFKTATVDPGADAAADRVNVNGTDGDDQFALLPGAVQLGGTTVNVPATEPGDLEVAVGGAGDDTATYTGTAGDDQISFGRNADAVFVAAGNALLANAQTEHLVIKGLGGNDLIAGQNGVATIIPQVTLDGGNGDDDLRGGDSADTLLGGSGNDHIDGNIGADSAQMGSGNDRFQWDPGDGSDTVDGQSGTDALDFNGSNAGETIAVAGHQLTRNIGGITMNYSVEGVNVRTLGSADTVTTGDLDGLKSVNVDLGAFDGGDDGAADDVIVGGTDGDDEFALGDNSIKGPGGVPVSVTNQHSLDRLIADGGLGDDAAVETGTAGDDSISFGRNGDAVFVSNGTSLVNTRTEHTLIQGLGGNDQIAGQNGIADLTRVTLDGGSGDDDLRGGDGDDLLLGGSGDDLVDGNRGNDTAQMGSGTDTFQWDPGDGSDTVDGQSGTDSLAFNGSNIGEELVASADGSHVRFTRNVAAVSMDLDNVEGLALRTLGGVDLVTVGDLSGTDMKTAAIDLGAFDGTPDATSDTVTLNGTAKRDNVAVTKAGGQVLVNGLPTRTTIAGSDPGIDLLRVNTLAGDDSVTVAPDVADLIATAVDLGADG